MSKLFETLVAELERPRELSDQVLRYLGKTFSIVDPESVGAFLATEVPGLEDYEIDLLLSPDFTPKLRDQAVYAQLLGGESVGRELWPGLVQSLVSRPTRAHFITADGRSQEVELRSVTIERYLNRLRLDGMISPDLLKLLARAPVEAQPLMKAMARLAVWDEGGRRGILELYVAKAMAANVLQVAGLQELVRVVESRKPSSVTELIAKIPIWQESLREQLTTAAGPKPFFMDRIEQLHGGERDQRSAEDFRTKGKQDELAFLIHLAEVLAT